MKRIKDILKDKGILLVRTDESGKWFVHCWLLDGTVRTQQQGNLITSCAGRSIYRKYVDDIEQALDDVIEIIGG